MQAWNRYWPSCVVACRALVLGPPFALRVVPDGLDLPLLPSPRLAWARRVFLLLVLAYGLELAVGGHRFAVPAVLGLAGGFWWYCRWMARDAPARPRRLVLAADGRTHLLTLGGRVEEVRIEPGSLRLGCHILLVVHRSKSTTCLLLGPDNLTAAELAGLARRLPTAGGPGATALHSGASMTTRQPPSP